MRKKGNRYRVDKAMRRKRVLSCAKTTFGALLVFVSVLLLSAALAHSFYALLDAPWLRVEEVDIVGLKRITRSEILNAMGVPKDTSILTLKMSQLTNRLESLPLLRYALVRLDTPGRLVVEVVEREPLAIVSGDGSYLLDAEGKLFLRSVPEQHPKLLVVGGFSGSGVKEGDVLPPDVFQGIKRLLTALERSRSWLPVDRLAECTWSNETGFVIRIGESAIRVQLGSDNLDQKLGRLQEILRILAERQWLGMVTTIDLDYANRAYVEGQFPTFKGI